MPQITSDLKISKSIPISLKINIIKICDEGKVFLMEKILKPGMYSDTRVQ